MTALLTATTPTDERVAAAVADFRAAAIQIRARSAKLFSLSAFAKRERADEQAAIDDLIGDMQARCDRLGITLDDLFAAINADLARHAEAKRPSGSYRQYLLMRGAQAHDDEAAAHERLTQAQAAVRAATAARLAADRACLGFYASGRGL